jgi:hypothetical protein
MHCRGFQMIEKHVLRLVLGMGLPIVSALIMEQLPKSGVAEVPFAFQVEQQTLPAGSYSVKQADLGRSVRIQSEKSTGEGLKCLAVKRKFGKAQGARLVFENYQGHYLLSEIWFDADGRGLILQAGGAKESVRSTRDERELRSVRFQ